MVSVNSPLDPSIDHIISINSKCATDLSVDGDANCGMTTGIGSFLLSPANHHSCIVLCENVRHLCRANKALFPLKTASSDATTGTGVATVIDASLCPVRLGTNVKIYCRVRHVSYICTRENVPAKGHRRTNVPYNGLARQYSFYEVQKQREGR